MCLSLYEIFTDSNQFIMIDLWRVIIIMSWLEVTCLGFHVKAPMIQTVSFKKHLSSPLGANVFGGAAALLKCLGSHTKSMITIDKIEYFLFTD